MEMQLTTIQKRLIAIARNKGHITITDFVMSYSCRKYIKKMIDRFCRVKIIRPTKDPEYFKYNKKNDTFVLSLLKGYKPIEKNQKTL